MLTSTTDRIMSGAEHLLPKYGSRSKKFSLLDLTSLTRDQALLALVLIRKAFGAEEIALTSDL